LITTKEANVANSPSNNPLMLDYVPQFTFLSYTSCNNPIISALSAVHTALSTVHASLLSAIYTYPNIPFNFNDYLYLNSGDSVFGAADANVTDVTESMSGTMATLDFKASTWKNVKKTIPGDQLEIFV
jgi:hypothetical protein